MLGTLGSRARQSPPSHRLPVDWAVHTQNIYYHITSQIYPNLLSQSKDLIFQYFVSNKPFRAVLHSLYQGSRLIPVSCQMECLTILMWPWSHISMGLRALSTKPIENIYSKVIEKKVYKEYVSVYPSFIYLSLSIYHYLSIIIYLSWWSFHCLSLSICHD